MKKQGILFASILFLTFYSCQKNENDQNSEVVVDTKEIVYKEFTDDLNQKIKIPFPPKRVIGLAPSLTEILFKICPDFCSRI